MDEDDLRHEVCQVRAVPGLYVTDWVGAASVNEANILGITHILSVLSNQELETYGPDESSGVKLRHLNVDDHDRAQISKYFNRECDWLDSVLAKKDTAVIVHCQQGVSRSVAIVIAYQVIKKLDMSFDEALAEVRRSRSIVNLNQGFVEQLKEWESCNKEGNLKLGTVMTPNSRVHSNSISRPVDVISPVDIIDFVERKR